MKLIASCPFFLRARRFSLDTCAGTDCCWQFHSQNFLTTAGVTKPASKCNCKVKVVANITAKQIHFLLKHFGRSAATRMPVKPLLLYVLNVVVIFVIATVCFVS